MKIKIATRADSPIVITVTQNPAFAATSNWKTNIRT